MRKNQLKELLIKYLNDTIQVDELHQLLNLLDNTDTQAAEPVVDQLLETDFQQHIQHHPFNQDDVLRRIRIATHSTKRKHALLYWVAASTVGMVVAISIFFHQQTRESRQKIETASTPVERFLPTGKQAMLHLADGTSYNLMDTDTAVLHQIGVDITTTANGDTCFLFTPTADSHNEYHTLENGTGMICQLQLADGSRVWLNSRAKLSYPSRFAASKRLVHIEGEAFFDVARDAHTPFEVASENTVVRVLGTQFNIASDTVQGTTRTTLFDGSVEVNKGHHSIILNPGWQATTKDHTTEIATEKVNIGEVAAWKEGYFRFNDHTISTVMDQLVTWYGIQHVYLSGQMNDRFTGSIRRSQKLTEVLEQLAEISNYTFTIKERSVYVMN